MRFDPRQLFAEFGPALAYVAVVDENGDESIGAAYHVGEGVFVTARHVCEGKSIREIATTESHWIRDPSQEQVPSGMVRYSGGRAAGPLELVAGPLFHPNADVDVAALRVTATDLPAVPLGTHLDDWLGTELVLTNAVVMGYPPVPTAASPVLVSARAEVNAIVDRYGVKHPHFILSSMARGGFSGGPAISEFGFALGTVTHSLCDGEKPPEAGYLAVLSIEPIYECLAHHGILPKLQRDGWDGFWTSRTSHFQGRPGANLPLGHSGAMVIRRVDPERPGVKIVVHDQQLLADARRAAMASGPCTVIEEKPYLVELSFEAGSSVELEALLGRASRAAVAVFRESGRFDELWDSQDGDGPPTYGP